MKLGSDLPRASAKSLVVYVLGAGVGESVVVAFPDGHHLVMDAACIGSDNLPAMLLKHLGVSKIDLLVLSHPDLDHIRGMAELVDDFSPSVLWRYPQDSAVRDFLVRWAQENHHKDLATRVELGVDEGQERCELQHRRVDVGNRAAERDRSEFIEVSELRVNYCAGLLFQAHAAYRRLSRCGGPSLPTCGSSHCQLTGEACSKLSVEA